MSSSPPPPSASAFLQKHTHHAQTDNEKPAAGGATEIVSNLIEGIVGGGAQTSPDESVNNSMKHRNSDTSYDQRVPKMTYDNSGDKPVPYKGFGSKPQSADAEASARPKRFEGFSNRIRGFFSPRATDVEQMVTKLHNQFVQVEVDCKVYALKHDGSQWGGQTKPGKAEGGDDRDDPKHPLNNPKLMTDVHFVGRKARDPAIIEISSLLANCDRFGCITELWLNNNLITDDGAAAIASFLQLPTCALTEVWLGENQIGPAGTTFISAALSNNEKSKLKCLGLYKNPIGNGGATSLAQMLRKNHTVSTVDIHGCGTRNNGSGSDGNEVLEGYGCKVVKASNGTEYVARVVNARDAEEGVVTDERLLDAIQTFVAFNRINPTREQAIRGIMASNKQGTQNDAAADDEEKEQTSEQKYQTHISNFLSGLCNEAANEKLTDKEKHLWKDCEWERLDLELEKVRAAKKALAKGLVSNAGKKEESWQGDFTIDEEEGGTEMKGEDAVIGHRDLDDEVVKTDAPTWRDLKLGITGSARVGPRPKKVPAGKGHKLGAIADNEAEERSGTSTPPPSAFQAANETANAVADLEKALETVSTEEEGVKTSEGEDGA